MRKYLFGVLLSMFGVLAAIYFFVGVPKVYETAPLPSSIPHLFGDVKQPIGKVDIAAFYFVPKDKTELQVENWFEVIDKNLQKLQAFHRFQFLGKSEIEYRIYPEPIIGFQESRAYDTEQTEHGNPEALSRIALELEGRVPDIARAPEGAYRVIVIIYEGVGDAGSDNVALLGRAFLTNEEYSLFAATFLAHEFYHTLGIPDGYIASAKVFPDGQQTSIEILTSGDLMARIRIPIEYTYLQRDTLRTMGL